MRTGKVFLVLAILAGSLSAQALRVKDDQVILDKLSDYETCQTRDRRGQWCHDALVRWVESHPADAFQAGKLTRQQMNAWGALEFFEKAFAKGQGDCKDRDVELAVLGGLEQPKSNDQAVKRARAIGLDKCFAQMQPALVENAKVGSNTFKNICTDLSKKGLLGGLKKKKCDEQGQG